MRRTRTALLVAILSLGLLVPGIAVAGNGAPQGAHDYQLNIIGTSDKNPNMTGGNGHRIFVPLEGRSKIMLSEGDFGVLDANGTDGEASFSLPAPGLDAYVVGEVGDADVQSSYSVFIRPLGKPGGSATITTCAELLDSQFGDLLDNRTVRSINNRTDGEAYCSIEQVGTDILTRTKGKSSFTNVTAEMLTIVFEVEVDLDGDGIADETIYIRVPIFDELLEGEYWEYDNNGLRLAQVRFYDCSTNVETGASTC
ncbi:hypothetical protein [Salsipaludibacter albus]|uniref:hypothetical protein n=1 Tax=Salsipaludibacter albus TaxID=2849650 RepID=UPI001EE3AEB6|nr:hypothetical protein [Salsipaludibacter albus]MBY5161442.1 hypothetical protein [Salsipaludibacter albus]